VLPVPVHRYIENTYIYIFHTHIPTFTHKGVCVCVYVCVCVRVCVTQRGRETETETERRQRDIETEITTISATIVQLVYLITQCCFSILHRMHNRDREGLTKFEKLDDPVDLPATELEWECSRFGDNCVHICDCVGLLDIL